MEQQSSYTDDIEVPQPVMQAVEEEQVIIHTRMLRGAGCEEVCSKLRIFPKKQRHDLHFKLC